MESGLIDRYIVLMNSSCAQCHRSYEISEEDLKFYSTFPIDPPRLCPDHRRQRRLSFRNERSLYRRPCDKCQKLLISVYSPEKPFTVYCKECWWSDSWDPMEYGLDFDFQKPFFDQFAQLMKKVPRLSIINFEEENSDYTNYGFQNKDCYLLFTSDRNEKCLYGSYNWNSFRCVDNFFLMESQFCYECIDGDKLYECQYCESCINCQNCSFCIDGKNLKNCFGCVGLQNKEYYFLNEQLTKDEYERKVKEALSDRTSFHLRLENLRKQFPRRAVFQINCENSLGDHVKNCKNVFMGFDGYGAEDCKWITNFPGEVVNCYDADGTASIEWSAEVISSGLATNKCFAIDHNWKGASEVYYSSYCVVNSNLFGCIGLRRKQYCILNQQYRKEEYEDLLKKIIEHMKKTGQWGEFFPMNISPFAYNESAAYPEYPLTKEEVLAAELSWKEDEHEALKVEKIISASKLPSDISQIPDDILSWAIECEVTRKPFKITAQELEFYRKFQIPVPHFHPDERHRQRMLKRNPRRLLERQCSICQLTIMTSYSLDQCGKICCEKCYAKNIYG